MELPAEVRIREVGPRDGFQNEPEIIATDDKVRLIDLLARTGLRRLEATSFVRPDVIPQLADASEVLDRIAVPEGVAVSVLVPNERGLERALAQRGRFTEISCFLSASESHNRANVNRSVEESVAGLERVLARTGREGLRAAAKKSPTWSGLAIPVVSPKAISAAPAAISRAAMARTRSRGTRPS